MTFAPSVLYRGHSLHRDPLFFNPLAGRWSSGDDTFGTLYLAAHPACAFLEAFGHLVVITSGQPMIIEQVLAHSCLRGVTTTRSLKLVDLTHGAALTALSADSRITNAPHQLSQQWAREFWAHPSAPDGVCYRSRRAPEHFCIAVFDRAADALRIDSDDNLLRNRQRLGAVLNSLGCLLIEESS